MSGIFENTLCSIPFQGNYLATASATANTLDLAQTAALIEREGLRFDGTANLVKIGSSGISPQGTSDFSYSVLVNLSSYDPTVNSFGSIFVGTTTGQINAFYFGVDLTGKLGVGITGAGWTFQTATSVLALNTPTICTYIRASGIGYIYVNGAFISSGTDSNNYSQFCFYLGYYSSPSSYVIKGSLAATRFFNYALTQAEITALNGRGMVTLPEQRGGSMTALTAGSFIVGKKYRIVTVGTTSFTAIGGSANTVGIEFTATGAGSGTGTALPLGTLFEQDSGQRNAGYQLLDNSGNNLDLILPATGVSIIDPAMRGIIRFTTTTSGNQQIGGTQVIIPTNARISSWVINSSGTPNVTLGDVSAGAQYRASAAVVSGDNQITLLTPFTSTGNLWVNSSTTATLKHTIMWEYIQ